MSAPGDATARAPLGSAIRIALATLGGWVIAVSSGLALATARGGFAPGEATMFGAIFVAVGAIFGRSLARALD